MSLAPELRSALKAAFELARAFRGATAPNPPVGAAALDRAGRILSVQAHPKAGQGHAEARVFLDCEARGTLPEIDTWIVTLEPCNHFGRTPPCTDAILRTPARRVIYALPDPNPRVPGGGAKRLQEAGLRVECLAETLREDPLIGECEELIEPFTHWVKTGLPWVTVKTAWTAADSMIPPPGSKTFTSARSLKRSHELRRQSDAIVTGSGTVLADRPEFTVRHIPDHPGKRRWLGILDRRRRIPPEWIALKNSQGFQVVQKDDFRELLTFLGGQGVLEVLVEAGPTLSGWILGHGLWNRHFRIRQTPDGNDLIDVVEVQDVHGDC